MIEELKQQIKKLIYSYGIIPILITLSEQEKKENYEMCDIILYVVKEIFEGAQVPTRYDEKTIEWICTTYPLVHKNHITANANQYVNIIYKELNLKRTYSIKLI